MTATPPWPTAATLPVSIRRRESGRIRGEAPVCGGSNAGLGSVRRQIRPRTPDPVNLRKALACNRLASNPLSVKPMHVACYGYRWYDPLTGRWFSRDSIGGMSTITFKAGSGSVNAIYPHVQTHLEKSSDEKLDKKRQTLKAIPETESDVQCYAFVRNDGLNLVDVLGMFAYPLHWPPIGVGPPPIPPDNGPTDPQGIIDEAMKEEKQEMPSGHGAHGGGYAHCVANCNLVRRLGMAAGTAGAALWALSETDPADNRANLIGQGLAHLRGSCGCLCKKVFPPQ